MEEKPGMIKLKPGIYRHFKGNEYRLLYTARHSETLEDMVVYRVRDQQSQESAQGYTLYFFRGEPLWFVLENYAVFKLEMIK